MSGQHAFDILRRNERHVARQMQQAAIAIGQQPDLSFLKPEDGVVFMALGLLKNPVFLPCCCSRLWKTV